MVQTKKETKKPMENVKTYYGVREDTIDEFQNLCKDNIRETSKKSAHYF